MILESESTEDGRHCRRYLQLVGNKYRAVVPFPVMSERIEPTDREIVACAVEHGCNTIVTLDKELIHNEKLENEFGIKIMHPKELL